MSILPYIQLFLLLILFIDTTIELKKYLDGCINYNIFYISFKMFLSLLGLFALLMRYIILI
jgi:hypothetical protein